MTAADFVKQTPAPSESRIHEPSMEEILASIRRIIADDQSIPTQVSVAGEELKLRAVLDQPETSDSFDPEPPSPVRAVFAPPPVAPQPSEPALARPVVASKPDEGLRNAVAERRPDPVAPEPSPPVAPAHGHIAAPQYAMPDGPASRETSAGRPEAVVEEPPQAPVSPSPVLARVSPQASPPPTARESDGADRAALFSADTDQSVSAAFQTLAATRLIENDQALKDLTREMLRPMLKSWLDDNLPVLVERLVRAEIERVGRGGR